MSESDLLAASNVAGAALRTAKAAKAPKAELMPLIDALKSAKAAYKTLTGNDPPQTSGASKPKDQKKAKGGGAATADPKAAKPKKEKKSKPGKGGGGSDLPAEAPFIKERGALFDQLYEVQLAEVAAKESVPIKITMPDGNVVDGESWRTTPYEVASGISSGLANTSIIAKVNDSLWDLDRPIEEDCTLALLKFDDPDGLYAYRHSSAHILGNALEKCYGGCLCAGPPVEAGFYYDMHIKDKTISTEELPKIEEVAKKCGKKKDPFLRLNISKANLLKMFAYNEFKCRIINERIGEEGSTVYKCGDLIDLCRGPHVRNTGKIKAMHMYRNSSAYFEGDAEAEVVQRVYGISFDDTKKLKEWKYIQAEAAKRNHRKIGVEQELFFFHDLSPGSCFFLPKGAFIYRQLLDLMREQYKIRGFSEVITPNIFNSKLWETSGHWDYYKDDMFSFDTEGETWALKPMNCPSHCLMFKHRTRSHKELPIRLADFGVLHRNESSGSLSGLTRVRRFQQDDAHIFVTPEMIEAEMAQCLDFLQYTYGQFDFTFELELSTRPEKYLGEISVWDQAEKQLENSLNAFGHPWKLNPADGAFYGPKIDITVRDALKRPFQCATIQLDFQLPLRFGLEYTPAVKNADGSPSRPVIIHRAILGSAERFIGILTEHYAGKFPFWLSPQQAVVVPVVPQYNKYALEVVQAMKAKGFTVEANVDDSLKLGKKVAVSLKTGYVFILVVGGDEEKNRAVSVRPFDGAQEKSPRSLEEVMAHFQALTSERRKDHSFGEPGVAGGKAAGMDVAAVGEWLGANELGKYQPLFDENQIDGQDLSDLTHEDLISMGVRSCHDRKEILRIAAEL